MKLTTLLPASLLLFLLACTSPTATPLEVSYLNPPSAQGKNLPYSEVVKVGQTLYLSGKIGKKAGENTVVEGGIQAETKQVMDNIKEVLQRHGADMDDIVKVTVFLADIGEWAAMNEVYTTYFPTHRPARSAVGVNGLARNAKVEIECIAILKK
ncbi:MAG: Rid family detoxifying hydrolase [Bacteroidota bacterium]